MCFLGDSDFSTSSHCLAVPKMCFSGLVFFGTLKPFTKGAPRNLLREGLNVKYRVQRGQNFEKMVFLSPKKSNCKVSLRKRQVFSDFSIKFRVNATKLSIFSSWGGGYSPLVPPLGVPLPFTLLDTNQNRSNSIDLLILSVD